MTWFNNVTWNPFKRNLTQAKEQLDRPDEMATSSIQEPEPGSIDWLYMDQGGEG